LDKGKINAGHYLEQFGGSCLPADGTNAAAEVKGDFGKSRRQLSD
jgi:hypothetical protein